MHVHIESLVASVGAPQKSPWVSPLDSLGLCSEGIHLGSAACGDRDGRLSAWSAWGDLEEPGEDNSSVPNQRSRHVLSSNMIQFHPISSN